MAELRVVGEPSVERELAAVEDALLARWPESKLEPSLDRIRALTDLLGDPQASYPVIHVTGTNGKTSTARMIEALLRSFGLRTGLFTSPHLESMRERICFDGVPIEPERFVDTFHDLEPYLGLVDAKSAEQGGHPLSFFEAMVGMAYAAFAEAPVDVAIVEVGMGGTWDATNVADGQVAVVTPVAIDHANYLGGSIEGIATEKAGIIKAEAFLVLAQQPVEVAEVMLRRAADAGATVAREGLEFGLRGRLGAVGGQVLAIQGLGGLYEELFLPLLGEHQAHNAACALAAVEAFLGGGSNRLDLELVRAGFADARSPGRLEVVRRAPAIVLDAAHNPAGAEATAAAVQTDFDFTRLVGVLGVMGDKDARGILAAFEPVLAEVVITAVPGPRSMDPDLLAAQAVEIFGEDRVQVVPRLDDALETAIELAEDGAEELAGIGVLVTGSVVLAGAARALLGRKR
ncbi:MAG TPA: folylpolyglutamate synthase/dihydrofolate synthase family protein [Sporichthya sp.]|nr:folylpolyglutamate synthase/dihydrofolate synthase family protein [Sporichthya sp.]